jgi:pimeloyl-ACP methyl ester carboxylesterase
VKFFSGFSLVNEDKLFKEYIVDNDFTIVGFSYGAIKAFEYTYNTTNRVDRLILLSPAFFQNQPKNYARRQLRYFQNSPEEYTKQFLLNVAYPNNINLNKYRKEGSKDELKELLEYQWDKDKIKTLQKKGIIIEIFLGVNDRIIDTKSAFNFFSKITTTYIIKNTGHLLD